MKKLVYALILMLPASQAWAEDPQTEEDTFRILGLFMEVRVEAFKQAMTELEDIEVVDVDYTTGEARLRLSGPFRLQNGDRDKQLRALNERVRIGSKGAFEVLGPQEKPLSERTRIEIGIHGHDCLGCSFGAYRAVYRMNGVYRVTADFGEGTLVAWIDPGVTDREALEAELTNRKVLLADKPTGD